MTTTDTIIILQGSRITLLSATQANPSIPDMSPSAQKKHEKHLCAGKSYPGMTMIDYVNMASELARAPVGGDIVGYKCSDGGIVRYNKAEGDFVKARDTGVATMFKPLRGDDYYNDQILKDGGVFND
jgi:hypothetical protein